MSEHGERLIEAMKEAVEVAKGNQPAHSITVNGHTYYNREVTDEMVERAERVLEDWAYDAEERFVPTYVIRAALEAALRASDALPTS